MLRGQFEFRVLAAARKAIRNQAQGSRWESSMGALQEQTLKSRGHSFLPHSSLHLPSLKLSLPGGGLLVWFPSVVIQSVGVITMTSHVFSIFSHPDLSSRRVGCKGDKKTSPQNIFHIIQTD